MYVGILEVAVIDSMEVVLRNSHVTVSKEFGFLS